LTWSNYIRFRVSHRRHHMFTAHYPQELEVVLPKGMGKIDWLFAFLPNPIFLVSTLWGHFRRSLGMIRGQWERRLFPPRKVQMRRRLIRWSRIVLLGHLALATLLIYFQLWPGLVLITGGVFLGSWLVPACTMPQHVGLQPNVPDFRLCTRTMYLGPVLRFLYWNMNYHIEHHMYASVPFHKLGRLHEAIRHDLPPVKKGLWANWRQMLPVMARQKREPDYFLRPECPAGTGDRSG
jgi:fatty acid desaturase